MRLRWLATRQISPNDTLTQNSQTIFFSQKLLEIISTRMDHTKWLEASYRQLTIRIANLVWFRPLIAVQWLRASCKRPTGFDYPIGNVNRKIGHEQGSRYSIIRLGGLTFPLRSHFCHSLSSIFNFHDTRQNYANSYVNDINGTVNETVPSWLPDNIKDMTGNVQVKLLCGADLLESFSVPGLWSQDDVSVVRPKGTLDWSQLFVFFSQIEAILGQHGIVVISRSGSNPEKFIFESDLLNRYKVNIIFKWICHHLRH